MKALQSDNPKPPQRVELLAPAGNIEKLEIAVHFGADAVYLAGKSFSLRNFSGNFTLDEMATAVSLCRSRNVRVYVACNIYSRNEEQKDIRVYLKRLRDIRPDGIIVADPAIFMAAREILPGVPIHISTQTNTMNYATARFWRHLGADRIIAARELNLQEIREIVDKGQIAVEAFVHGAMCIAYSGRCLLSSFLADRDSNRGRCAHPCRWNYAVVEEKRPGQYMPLREDDHGTYIFNSRDLCMIDHIPALVASGVAALKIEGRMKGIHYVASTVKTYREAIDAYYADPQGYHVAPEWRDNLESINQRGYSTGFYLSDPSQIQPNRDLVRKGFTHRLVGKIRSASSTGRCCVEVRNRLAAGDTIEILSPGSPVWHMEIPQMVDDDDNRISVAHAGMRVFIPMDKPCRPNDLIRRQEPVDPSPPRR